MTPKRRLRKRKLSKAEAKAFLATQQGQLWLERKIAEKNARRRDPGPTPERLTRTKFPFTATINDREATVWSIDRIEYKGKIRDRPKGG